MQGYPVRSGIFFALICSLLLLLPSSIPMTAAVWNQPDPDKSGWVEKKIAQMTLDEKIGQMFMVGFQNGDQPAREVNEQVQKLILEEHVGGIILFDRNVENPWQVAGLTRRLQQLSLTSSPGIPLLISMDQEGGKIVRMREGVTVFPGNMAIGATRDSSLAYRAGRITGEELRAMGINMNLAPVLDVNNNAKNPIIGVRSFAGDPVLAARMATANLKGYRQGGVLTAVKHFPGHGDTTTDSHIDVPTVPHSLKRLEKVELVPFQKAIEQGVDAVMSAHITFPAIDDTPGLPGTLSKKVLTGLLREKMGYHGVIITDDMEMGAIVENFGADEAAVRAVKAGADMILVSHDLTRQRQSIRSVKKAVKKGDISEDRIDRSLRRILKLKTEKLGERAVLHQPKVEISQVDDGVGTEEHQRQALRIAEAALTQVRDHSDHLPLNPKKTPRVLALSPNHADVLGKAFASRGFRPVTRSIDPDPDSSVIRRLSREAARADAIVIGTSQAGKHPSQADLVQELEATGKPVIVLGLDTPYDLLSFPRVSTYLALYSSNPVALRAAVKGITGEIPITGKLPVEIPGMYPAGHGRTQP
ncbi:beta-N-acetylhexosaminidase [Paludifilum halophilum]|uniref:beta-N-acetylhexosaminidase n=1 Tax=Paludifilum halophilum TaxID=1642702 RepID=A0A235B9M6_9BACL|nr:beta-N-acetylhexosaminidase [Paludifilum halophilum]OYD09010.1 beta-N-acetylhexosaminidase [Paludifilum halophilum]